MSPIQALGLGIIQGLTEFLPISSSGHLVLAQSFIPQFSQPGVLFDAVLHAGTALAVLWYFRKTLLTLSGYVLLLLALGTVPAALAGLFLGGSIEGLFASTKVVGFALLVTAAANYLVDKAETGRKEMARLNLVNALLVGVAQATALVPGISRSGATIFAGVFQGVKKEDAASFSFLLSVPAVAGAVFLQLIKYGSEPGGLAFQSYLIGAAAAFVMGYFSIGVVMKFIKEKRFKVFAYYCFLVGVAALLLSV